jgi:hypothetical protein
MFLMIYESKGMGAAGFALGHSRQDTQRDEPAKDKYPQESPEQIRPVTVLGVHMAYALLKVPISHILVLLFASSK